MSEGVLITKDFNTVSQWQSGFDKAAAIADGMTPEEIEELEILLDPVKWAFVNLGWIPYDYQEPLLRLLKDSSNAVFRMGRRIGKCLPGYITVFDPKTGQRPTIKELFDKQQATVATMTCHYKMAVKKTNMIFENDINDVFRIRLKSGRFIDATGNHPLLRITGWTEVSDLRIGDKIAIPAKLDCFSNKTIPVRHIKHLAHKTSTHVPNIIFKLRKQDIALFLYKLYITSGRIKHKYKISYYTKSQRLAFDLQHLLLRFGIHANILYINNIYNLCISSKQDIRLFINNIGKYSPLTGCNKQITDNTASDIYWDKIVSIKALGEMQTYDLTISDTHNFVANDIITHNSEQMCLIILWYAFTQYNKKETNASNEMQYKILIITPFETQIDTIFDRLSQLIEASATLKDSILKHNKHDIRLKNGSQILGLTAGTKNNSGAASTRSKGADVLVLDEVDYMAEEDITNVLNVRNEDPKRIRTICASTPAGKRQSYYRWCTEATTSYHADSEYLEETGILRYRVITAKDKGIRGNGWTEFYAPSQVNRKLLEINTDTGQTYLDDIKDSLPSYRYEQEILALFGEEEMGVYQKRFIDYAILQGRDLSCSYANMQARPYQEGNIRILGVDWDKVAAETSLLAYEYDAELEKFIPLDKIAIPRSKITYTIAVQQIIDLNYTHNFDWIVIDRGYGETQLEQLHIYGANNPESGLAKKIIPIHFSNMIPIRDPITKLVDKKDVKPFMINNSVNMFEKGLLVLNPNDKQIIQQLERYSIISVGRDGKPVYSNKDEHWVDALNLCMLGFAMKYDKLLKQRLSSKVNRIPILDNEIANTALVQAGRISYLNDISKTARSNPLFTSRVNTISGIGVKSPARRQGIARNYIGRKTF